VLPSLLFSAVTRYSMSFALCTNPVRSEAMNQRWIWVAFALYTLHDLSAIWQTRRKKDKLSKQEFYITDCLKLFKIVSLCQYIYIPCNQFHIIDPGTIRLLNTRDASLIYEAHRIDWSVSTLFSHVCQVEAWQIPFTGGNGWRYLKSMTGQRIT
jgi:hypothetical protein